MGGSESKGYRFESSYVLGSVMWNGPVESAGWFGTVINVNWLTRIESDFDTGEITMGLNNSMDTAAAVRGSSPFRKKLENVRILARVWIIPEGILVRGDSGIKSLADLRGKRVVTDIKTIVSMGVITRRYLASGSISVDDLVAVKSGGIVKSVNMVVEGRADAAVVGMGMPQVRKAHATTPGGIRFLPLGSRGTAEFILSEPGMSPHKAKPAKRYPYVDRELNLIAIDTYLNAGPTVSSELAYKIVKSLLVFSCDCAYSFYFQKKTRTDPIFSLSY